VQRDEIGAGKQFVKLNLFNAQFLRTRLGQ